jgi:hypothetical protein
MSADKAYTLWGAYPDTPLPELFSFLKERYPDFSAALQKKMEENDVEEHSLPAWLVQEIGAHLRAAWIADEAEAEAFIKMAESPEDEDACHIHGSLHGDEICAACHYSYKETCCFRGTCAECHVDSVTSPTKEEMAHWESHETARGKQVTTCWGCRENQPNQLAHTDVGGCLYQDEY